MTTTIRTEFHAISNQHNLVTIGSGVAAEDVKRLLIENKDNQGLKEELEELKKALNSIENHAMQADKILMPLKKYIYSKINPDENVELKEEQ